MKHLFKFFVLAIAVVFYSCSEFEGIWVKSEFPDDKNISLLDMWAHKVPFQVQSNGDWKIETHGDWFYVYPTSGRGNETLQISVLENDTDERQTGMISIISTTDPSIVQTIEIGQKNIGDYGVTGILDNTTSIKKYAVGYGYNTYSEYASPNSVTKQIVKWDAMDAEGLIQFNAATASFYERTVVGSSLEQLAQNLSESVKFGGKYCGFRGEVKAAFNSSTINNEYNEYAISYVEYKVTDISIVTDIDEVRENWLTDAARRAINGETNTYKGTEGIKKLLTEYGTHIIMKADLGGRLRYNLSVDVSKVSGYYDITAYLRASYSNAFVSSKTTLDGEIKSSYVDNKQHTTLSFTAIGGNSGPLTDASDSNAIDAWKASITGYDNVNTNKTALIGFGSDLEGLVPIYELASDPARRDEIKTVLDGGAVVSIDYADKNNYEIEVPVFNAGLTGTLVKDIKDNNNRVIASVCNEFIPEINPEQRVNVIYPVAGGKILMHAGFFPGYEGRRPARISWNGSSLKIVDYDDLEEKEYKNIYLSGASVKTELGEEQTLKSTTVHESYLTAVHYNQLLYNYPLVKIFGNIWTREDYKSSKFANGNTIISKIDLQLDQNKYGSFDFNVQACNYGTNLLYKRSVIKNASFAPDGWEVPSTNHYKEIQAMLTKYNLNTAISLRSNPYFPTHSPLGYEAPTSEKDGWFLINLFFSNIALSVLYNDGGKENMYWTKEGEYIKMNDSGVSYETISDHVGYNDPDRFMSVRLIKKN